MILIIDIDNKSIESFSTLTKACKAKDFMSYQYLKDIKLSNIMRKYKKIYLCKV